MRKTVLLLFAILLAMTSFAQSAMTPKNTITPGAGEAWWGYFTDNDLMPLTLVLMALTHWPIMRLPLKL